MGAAWHLFEAAGLQPAVADGIVSRLPAQQPIDIGLAENAGLGEELGHEVCVGFGVGSVWVSNANSYLSGGMS